MSGITKNISVFRWYLPDLEIFKTWSSTPLNYDNNNCMCTCRLFSASSMVSNKCVQSYSKNNIWLSLSFSHVVLLLLSISLIIHSPWIVWTRRFCVWFVNSWLWYDCLNFNFSYTNCLQAPFYQNRPFFQWYLPYFNDSMSITCTWCNASIAVNLTLSLPRSKSTVSQTFEGKWINEVGRIGCIIIFHLWVSYEKPSSSYCDVIFLVRLWGCKGNLKLGVKGLNV